MSRFKHDDSYVHLGYESVTLSSDTVMALGLTIDGKSAQMSGRKGLYINADSVIENLRENFKKVQSTNCHCTSTSSHSINYKIQDNSFSTTCR